jgi:hypothetical protein
MYAVIVFPGGRQIDALILSASAERLRAVIPGRGDTIEFHQIEGRWFSENGVQVELGAIVAQSPVDANQVLDNACTARQSAA